MTGRLLPVGPLLERLGADENPIAARKLGIASKTMSRWRSGKVTGTTVYDADRYACRLGVHPSAVWGDAWWDIEDTDVWR